eukprot:1194706-Prorocentrum_minimum.AAC.3
MLPVWSRFRCRVERPQRPEGAPFCGGRCALSLAAGESGSAAHGPPEPPHTAGGEASEGAGESEAPAVVEVCLLSPRSGRTHWSSRRNHSSCRAYVTPLHIRHTVTHTSLDSNPSGAAARTGPAGGTTAPAAHTSRRYTYATRQYPERSGSAETLGTLDPFGAERFFSPHLALHLVEAAGVALAESDGRPQRPPQLR